MERYITNGIKAPRIPEHIQVFIWDLQTGIRKNNDQIDYLQVYDLQVVGTRQGITHRAEESQYEVKYSVAAETPIKEKIFIIEDRYGERIVETMLLAEEY